MDKCKHDNGWFLDKTHIYIYPNDSTPYYKPEFVEIGWTKRNKLLFKCNNCEAKRNIYLDAKVRMKGKIK